MGTERLTTLEAVKDWLGIDTDDSDTGLQRVIDAASRFTLNYLSRPSLMRTVYTTQWVGKGKREVLLREWPVLSIASVAVGGTDIAASTFNGANPSSGYYLSDDRIGPRTLFLVGNVFSPYMGSRVSYLAGFETSESNDIPADPFQLSPSTGGAWSIDRGVTIDGQAATEVASGPATGEYAVTDGVYTFAAADTGKAAIITYGYVPHDIAYAVTEIVGEWYKRKDRIGVLSKNLGGQETVTFSNHHITPVAASALQPYCNVVPA